MKSRRCTAICLDGSPCRAWAVRGSEPPCCAAHGGVCAPRAGGSALEDPLDAPGEQADPPEDCTIEAVIADLFQQQRQLDAYLRRAWHSEIDVRELAQLLRVHGQNAQRLGRLLRDRRALSGKAADGIAGAMAMALDELSNELGIDL